MSRMRGVLVGAVLLLAATNAWAQATAQINGTVSDSSGAVLPGVTVVAIQTDTGFRRETARRRPRRGPCRVRANRTPRRRRRRPRRGSPAKHARVGSLLDHPANGLASSQGGPDHQFQRKGRRICEVEAVGAKVVNSLAAGSASRRRAVRSVGRP